MLYRPVFRSGLSLIELLVVLAIMGVLAGLILSGTQRVRTIAARARCSNNLRQIALGFHHHHANHNVLPSNGGWDGTQTIPTAEGGLPVKVSTFNVHLSQTFVWGVGNPNLTPQTQTGSWAFAILSFVEQDAMYRQRVWTAPVSVYACQARRLPRAVVPQDDTYGTYSGGGWAWGKIDYAANQMVVPNRVFPDLARCWTFTGVTDGLSQTVLVGEKAMDPDFYELPGWFWDEPFFIGGSDSTSRTGSSVLQDAKKIKFWQNWGSIHPAGAQFALADGSVRTIAYGVPSEVVREFMTPRGGEIVPEPN